MADQVPSQRESRSGDLTPSLGSRVHKRMVDLKAENAALRGVLDSVLDAIGGDRFTDGLQTAEQYVRHRLSTAGHLYHVEGFMDVVKERDAARDALAEIATRPVVERNPDGVDQAAHTMQLIAREALSMEGS